MPESKLGEKWMYYDWSRVDQCFPLSVMLSLFVQGEISSWGTAHSSSTSPLSGLLYLFSFRSLSLIPFFFLHPCLSPLWRNRQSAVNGIQWIDQWAEICHSTKYLMVWNEIQGEKRWKLNTLWGVYKCGLLTPLSRGKSIYSLSKFSQSQPSWLRGRLTWRRTFSKHIISVNFDKHQHYIPKLLWAALLRLFLLYKKVERVEGQERWYR